MLDKSLFGFLRRDIPTKEKDIEDYSPQIEAILAEEGGVHSYLKDLAQKIRVNHLDSILYTSQFSDPKFCNALTKEEIVLFILLSKYVDKIPQVTESEDKKTIEHPKVYTSKEYCIAVGLNTLRYFGDLENVSNFERNLEKLFAELGYYDFLEVMYSLDERLEYRKILHQLTKKDPDYIFEIFKIIVPVVKKEKGIFHCLFKLNVIYGESIGKFEAVVEYIKSDFSRDFSSYNISDDDLRKCDIFFQLEHDKKGDVSTALFELYPNIDSSVENLKYFAGTLEEMDEKCNIFSFIRKITSPFAEKYNFYFSINNYEELDRQWTPEVSKEVITPDLFELLRYYAEAFNDDGIVVPLLASYVRNEDLCIWLTELFDEWKIQYDQLSPEEKPETGYYSDTANTLTAIQNFYGNDKSKFDVLARQMEWLKKQVEKNKYNLNKKITQVELNQHVTEIWTKCQQNLNLFEACLQNFWDSQGDLDAILELSDLHQNRADDILKALEFISHYPEGNFHYQHSLDSLHPIFLKTIRQSKDFIEQDWAKFELIKNLYLEELQDYNRFADPYFFGKKKFPYHAQSGAVEHFGQYVHLLEGASLEWCQVFSLACAHYSEDTIKDLSSQREANPELSPYDVFIETIKSSVPVEFRLKIDAILSVGPEKSIERLKQLSYILSEFFVMNGVTTSHGYTRKYHPHEGMYIVDQMAHIAEKYKNPAILNIFFELAVGYTPRNRRIFSIFGEIVEAAEGDEHRIRYFFQVLQLFGETGINTNVLSDLLENLKVSLEDGVPPQQFDWFGNMVIDHHEMLSDMRNSDKMAVLVGAANIYQENDALFLCILNFLKKHEAKVTKALCDAHKLYGKDKILLERTATVISELDFPSQQKLLGSLAHFYGANWETFMELRDTVATFDDNFANFFLKNEKTRIYPDLFQKFVTISQSQSVEHCEKLISCVDVCTDFPERLESFSFILEEIGPGAVFCLQKSHLLYDKQPEEFLYVKENLIRLYADRGEEGCETLGKMADIYQNNKELFDTFLSIIRVEGVTICKNLPQAEDVYHKDREKLLIVVEFFKLDFDYDKEVLERYVQMRQHTSRDVAQEYLFNLRSKARQIIGPEPAEELRHLPEYRYLVSLVYPQGTYSTYEKNLACGDKLEHIAHYDYKKEGYPVELTGILGYRLAAGSGEDKELLESYQKRLQTMQEFIVNRGPDNERLQKDFDEKVDTLFDTNALEIFKNIENLSPKEKLLTLFISEAVRKGKEGYQIDKNVLDLVVLYKYAYIENLEAYIQRSADGVRQHKDEISQHYGLWTELSNIYGENLKHVLQHDIFEELAKNGKNYNQIIDAVGALFTESSESFQLSPRELQSIDVIFKKKVSSEEKYQLVLQKLADLFGPQLKLKGSDQKQSEQQAQYDIDRGRFVAMLDELFETHAENLDTSTVALLMEKAFVINPRQLARFENTFDNEQIPLVDMVVKEKLKESKYKVLLKQTLEIFGSNIKFKNNEEYAEFEAAVVDLLAPLETTIDKKQFFALIPKLRTLRNQYRFGVNRKLEELFSLDINTIFRELAKYEEVLEVDKKQTQIGGERHKEVKKSPKKRNIRGHITKTQESSNARMGAYLCIAGDKQMWNNTNYFELVMKEEESGRCVGLVMFLNIESNDGKKYLWFGPNPFESFLDQVDSKRCYEYMYKTAVEFADKNGYDGIVIPSDEGRILGECTNRGGNFPQLIKDSRLLDSAKKSRIVSFGSTHTLGHYGGSPYSYSDGALIWEPKKTV